MAVPIAGGWPSLWMFAAFGVGAVVMRGAGCTFNDIVDRDLDAKVARTANRPLPAGKVTLVGAGLFLFAQCILGLAILFSFNSFAVTIGLLSVGLVVIYPFMKRVTYWPQLFLGLTFNWGALLGWAAHSGSLSVAAWLLYCGGIFWTIGYDTIYAHQDKEDDALIGVKSSALRLGARTGTAMWGFYGLALPHALAAPATIAANRISPNSRLLRNSLRHISGASISSCRICQPRCTPDASQSGQKPQPSPA